MKNVTNKEILDAVTSLDTRITSVEGKMEEHNGQTAKLQEDMNVIQKQQSKNILMMASTYKAVTGLVLILSVIVFALEDPIKSLLALI